MDKLFLGCWGQKQVRPHNKTPEVAFKRRLCQQRDEPGTGWDFGIDRSARSVCGVGGHYFARRRNQMPLLMPVGKI